MLPPVCNPGCQSCSYLFVTYWMAQPRKGAQSILKGKKYAHLFHMEPRAWKVHHFTMFFPYFSVSLFGEHTFCIFVPYIFPEGATPQPANDRIQGMSHNFHELQIAMAVWLEQQPFCHYTFSEPGVWSAGQPRVLPSRNPGGNWIPQQNCPVLKNSLWPRDVPANCTYNKGYKLFEMVFLLNPLP